MTSQHRLQLTASPAADSAASAAAPDSSQGAVAPAKQQDTAAQASRQEAAADDRLQRSTGWSKFWRRPEFASALGGILIFALFFAIAPSFRSWEAFATVLYASATLGIVALAVGLLMIGDEFDLSSGVAVTTAALAATMLNYNLHLNTWVGIGLSLLIALSIGALNGLLVTRTGIPSFLITLSAFFMLQGLNLAITKAVTGQVATPSIADMQGFDSAKRVFAGSITIGDVTFKTIILWWLVFVALGSWLLYKTTFGNWISAVGGNQDAARAVGVPVRRTKVALFMFVGFAAWFVGMHNLFAFDSIQAGQGVGNEFLYIIAAVIGGCALTGGRGTAVGTAIGAFIFGMTNQGIVFAGWNPDWFKFFLGAMLLWAVFTNNAVAHFSKGRS